MTITPVNTLASTQLVFDPIKHKYTYQGEVIPSVTQILKHAGIVDYSFIAPDVLAAAMERGSHVHLATQYLDEGDLDQDGLDPAIIGYLKAYERFKYDSGFVPDKIEEQIINLQYKYAGTIDRTGALNGKQNILLDIKTGSIPAWTGIQLAAYAAGLGGTWQRIGLQLNADGTYSCKDFHNPTEFNLFLSALAIYRWKQKNGGVNND